MPESAPTAGLRVLVADDDPVSLRFLEGALRELGCLPTAVGDGRAVLTVAAAERFDLLLLDRRMPGSGGAELLSALRRAGVDAPAIATSADLDPTMRAGLSAAGYLDALLKPISMESLARAIAALGRYSGPPGSADATGSRQPGAPDAAAAAEAVLLDDAAGLQAVGGDAATLTALRNLLAADLETLTQNHHFEGDAFADTLHRLRAACRYCGATRLERTVGAIEKNIRAGDSVDAPSLSAFRACCAETKLAIAKKASA